MNPNGAKKTNTTTSTTGSKTTSTTTTTNGGRQPTGDKNQTVKPKNPETKTSNNDQNQKASFIKKINLAKTVFDYSEENKDSKLKSERITAINELIEMLSDQRHFSSLFIPHIEPVMEMITKNIFRPLPSLKKNNIKLAVSDTGVQDEEQESDPAWPHLRGIYEIFLQLIVNEACEVRTLKQFISLNFIQEFLQLFDSEENEERDFLKNILHRLYAKLVPRRKMIRKAITDNFHILIHEIHKFNGASELLDILASIISGFAVPLREEHVVFFKNIIIPLHKVQTSHTYFDNLIRCSMLFLTKDSSLAIPLLEGILKYWPFANFAKELLFLQELPEVLEFCDPPEKLKPLITKLFKRIVKCISGLHLQVADRAMCLFESESFIQIIKYYKSITFNMLVPVIVKLADNHWHKMLQESLSALKEILHKIDPSAYDLALENPEQKKADK
jgi:serine/threonine-protein phosphatase 2A regulatory subunit B'